MAILQQPCEPLDWEVFLDLVSRMSYDIHLHSSISTRKKLARHLVIIASGCYLGVRGSDLLTLTWKDLLSNKRTWIIKEGKTDKKRIVTLNPELLRIVAYCHKVAEPFSNEIPILHNKEVKPVLITELNRILKKTFSSYKIVTINPSSHTLRKTFGKRVYQSLGSTEAALILLSKIFNHSSTSMTRDYIGITKVNVQNPYISI